MKSAFHKSHNQKGAIFGFDARIAIAIFALLSVTAGYYALGKLEQVRNAAVLNELQNLEMAIQSYQADMGVFYGYTISENNGKDDFKALYNKEVLKRKFQNLWNGPYIEEETTEHSLLGRYFITYYRDDMSPCEASGDCHTFIAITDTPIDTWNFINGYVDESLGTSLEREATKHLTGKIRSLNLKAEQVTLLYKTTSRKNKRF